MPRSAATIFGLVLVAVSIGFNTWRYPIVWQMAGSATAASVATPAVPKAMPAAAQASHPSATNSPVQPIRSPAAEPQAVRAAANEMAAGDVPSLGASPKIGGGAGISPASAAGTVAPQKPAVEQEPSAPTSLEKPLVAVPKLAALASGTAEADNGVRRLPPVDPNVPPMSGPYASGALGGTIPIYPSTGIK